MDEQNKVSGAIGAKYPTAGFTVGTTYDSLNWLSEDIPKPTQSEFDKAIADYNAEYDSKEYQRKRIYPHLGEQLDLLFHDMSSGKGDKTGEWYKAISKIKSDNPK